MTEKTDWKTPVIVVVVVIVVAIIIFMIIRGSFSKKLSQEDIQISNFRYDRGEDSVVVAELPFHSEKGKIKTVFTTAITTNKRGLSLKVYNAKNDLEISVTPSTLTNIGSNKISGYDLYLSSLSQEPELKFCISTKYKFNQYSKGVVCKIETFDNPEFKYEITPNPITFLINEQNKESGFFRKEETITIKNIGDINVPIYIKFSESSWNEPFYGVTGGSCRGLLALRPGEKCEYIIESALIAGVDILETYEDQGFIYGIGDEFKKEFILKTIVNL